MRALETRVRWRILAALALSALAVGALLLAACGGGNGSAEAEATKAARAAADSHEDEGHEHAEGDEHGASDQTVVHVILDEWVVRLGHDGEETTVTVPAGKVTFEIHNEGQSVHELAVLRTDLPVDDLPQSGGAVDEDAAGELIGRTEYLSSGAADVLSLDLEPGTYALICNIPGHYQQGMYATLVVE